MEIPKIFFISKSSYIRKAQETIDGKSLFEVTEKDLAKLKRADRRRLQELLPTPDERLFFEIFTSTMPELMRLQRKLSICLTVEVTAISDESVTFEFAGDTYTLNEPRNSFAICKALDKSSLDGFSEMLKEGCVEKNGAVVTDKDLKIDELRLLCDIATRFFFQIFLHF